MKRTWLIISLFGLTLTGGVYAQTKPGVAAVSRAANGPGKAAAPSREEPVTPGFLAPDFQMQTARRSRESAVVATPGRGNEIRVRKKVLSGIAVQVVKTRNPLQLINPFAPAEYGSGWDNVVRDTGTGNPVGLKVLAVGFN